MRTPISLVRSMTLTNMMFMMPMPPTSSDTAAMPARSALNVPALSARATATGRRPRPARQTRTPAAGPLGFATAAAALLEADRVLETGHRGAIVTALSRRGIGGYG
jgi:hypothetical protein